MHDFNSSTSPEEPLKKKGKSQPTSIRQDLGIFLKTVCFIGYKL